MIDISSSKEVLAEIRNQAVCVHYPSAEHAFYLLIAHVNTLNKRIEVLEKATVR